MRKVKIVEMEYWRKCVRKTRSDRVRNEEILKEMGIRKTIDQKSNRKKAEMARAFP